MFHFFLRSMVVTSLMLSLTWLSHAADSELLYYENFEDINPGVEWKRSIAGFFRETMPRTNNLPLTVSPDGGSAGALNDGSWAYHDLGVEFQANTNYKVSLHSARRFRNYGILEFGLFDGPPAPGTEFIAPALGSGVTLVTRENVKHRSWSPRKLSYQFTTSASAPEGNIVVLLRNTGDAGRAYVDGLTITATAIPEPASSLLALVPLCLAIGRRRL